MGRVRVRVRDGREREGGDLGCEKRNATKYDFSMHLLPAGGTAGWPPGEYFASPVS